MISINTQYTKCVLDCPQRLQLHYYVTMDLSQLPEKDRQKMVQYVEEKQVS